MIDMIIVLGIIIFCAYMAVANKNIVWGVIFLLGTNVGLAIIYYMMGAPTVALFQLAVFAGAVVVFFIITVMLTKAGEMVESKEEV
jgi:NADH-quinone oxidoreductase subunit J